jgi:hypothetical protein
MLNGAAPTNTTLTNATAGVLGNALSAPGASHASSGVTGLSFVGAFSRLNLPFFTVRHYNLM